MRIRLLVNCGANNYKANKILAEIEIIVVVLNKANKASLIM